MVDRDPDVPPPGFGEACASIARAVAESLALDQVVDRLAVAIRMIAPFDGMGVWLAEAPEDPVWLPPGPSPDIPSGGRPLRRSDHSPRLWPGPGQDPIVVGEAERDLDASFRADRVVVRGGYRSVLALPLDSDARQVLWLRHRAPRTYSTTPPRPPRPAA